MLALRLIFILTLWILLFKGIKKIHPWYSAIIFFLYSLNDIYLFTICLYFNKYFDPSINNLPICTKYFSFKKPTYFRGTLNGYKDDTRKGMYLSFVFFFKNIIAIFLLSYIKKAVSMQYIE